MRGGRGERNIGREDMWFEEGGKGRERKGMMKGVVLLCQMYSIILPLTLSGKSVSINHLRIL
jgi:hypothetical protein